MPMQNAVFLRRNEQETLKKPKNAPPTTNAVGGKREKERKKERKGRK